MPLNEMLLKEFDHEMENSRKTLERVSAEHWDWKPHQRSGTLGWLAGHVATLPGFLGVVASTPGLEIQTADIPRVEKHSELLDTFAKSRQRAREALTGLKDEQLRETWTLKRDGQVIFAMPRYDVVRTMCLNHIIHHRGQLTMYLRQLNVPVPALYGPSADENPFAA